MKRTYSAPSVINGVTEYPVYGWKTVHTYVPLTVRSTLYLSQGNPAPYRRGSAFAQATARRHIVPTAPVAINRNRGEDLFTGSFWDGHYGGLYDDGAFPSDNNNTYFGTRGYDRYKPGKPALDVARFIGELKDLKEMFRPYSKGPAGWGDYYLDYAFGKGAFVRDIVTLGLTAKNFKSKLEQLLRDNGKPIRREGVVDVQTENTTGPVEYIENGAFTYPILNGHMYNSPNKQSSRVLTHSLETKWWFSGRFLYNIPEVALGQVPQRTISKMLGANSISLAWSLMPWTWLADYYSNLGSIIRNFSDNAAENLVSNYAYIMCQESEVRTSYSNLFVDGKELKTSSSISIVRKSRAEASPYGFAVNPNGLTESQAAILAALGISKSGSGKFYKVGQS